MRLYHKLPFASWLAFPSIVVEPVITLLFEQRLSLSNDPAQFYHSIGGVGDRSLRVGNKKTRGEHCRNMAVNDSKTVLRMITSRWKQRYLAAIHPFLRPVPRTDMTFKTISITLSRGYRTLDTLNWVHSPSAQDVTILSSSKPIQHSGSGSMTLDCGKRRQSHTLRSLSA